MKTRTGSMTPTIACLAALLMGGATGIGMAQNTPPGKMDRHRAGMKGMEGMQGMKGMMEGPHQVLAMAYRDNLVTFAHTIARKGGETPAVNLDVARPAVAEMRRSYDQIQQHHQAHMAMMTDAAKGSMAETMEHMTKHLAALGQHLTALESELNAATPDPKDVAEHTREILKECDGMSTMHPKETMHPKDSK